MPDLDRKRLSKKVIYPENADFVLTKKGNPYPIDEVAIRVKERAKQHKPFLTCPLILLCGFMAIGSVFMAGFFMLVALETTAYQEKGSLLLSSCSTVICGIAAPLCVVAIYAAYAIDRDPDPYYASSLRYGTLSDGLVKEVETLTSGLTKLDYVFEIVVDVPNGKTRTQEIRHGKGTIQFLASKIYEPGDEIVILYVDDQLHIVL